MLLQQAADQKALAVVGHRCQGSLSKSWKPSRRNSRGITSETWLLRNDFWWLKNKNGVTPFWNPSKWNQGLKPAVPWCFNFDPYPNDV